MREVTHVSDQLPAYALGSLDQAEEQVVKHHLAGCETCRAELRSFVALTGELGLAAPQVEPPAELKAKIMQAIRPVPVPPRPISWQEKLRGLVLPWSLASLALIVALVVSNLALWRQVQELRSEPARPFQTIALAGTDFTPDATGLIVISTDGMHGTLVVDNLPPLDEQHAYQLWLIQPDGERTSGGTFNVGRDGYGSLWVDSPQPLASYPNFGITVEPAGGSPAPTGARVLGGNLDQ